MSNLVSNIKNKFSSSSPSIQIPYYFRNKIKFLLIIVLSKLNNIQLYYFVPTLVTRSREISNHNQAAWLAFDIAIIFPENLLVRNLTQRVTASLCEHRTLDPVTLSVRESTLIISNQNFCRELESIMFIWSNGKQTGWKLFRVRDCHIDECVIHNENKFFKFKYSNLLKKN